jgi:adenylate kinase family enzyme
VSRGRDDDKDESNIANKMTWFETEVLPTLEIYKADPRYTILHINGNQSIEEVHKDIVKGLGLQV